MRTLIILLYSTHPYLSDSLKINPGLKEGKEKGKGEGKGRREKRKEQNREEKRRTSKQKAFPTTGEITTQNS